MVRFFRRKQEVPAEEQPQEEVASAEPQSIEQAVERTRRTWFSRLGGIFRQGLSDELWEELEETLIAADTGVETTSKILEHLKERVQREGIRDPEEAQEALKEELVAVLSVNGGAGKLWGEGAT
ncbi:MAG TPA: signal recognition particle receptor subunit alpha, partial [Dehalococcoidia bacterium]|nr:signal recognition particle receptor subunit alpha [Dehalococcoidia bacterium]